MHLEWLGAGAACSWCSRLACAVQPINGCVCCGLQALFLALDEKRANNQSDKHFERQCKLQHHNMLPQPNYMPTSLRTVKKLLCCREVTAVEQHVCVNGCCKFNKLEPQQYKGAQAQKCTKCQELRFSVRSTARK